MALPAAARQPAGAQVLDTSAPAWECLAEGDWAAAAKPGGGAGACSAFSGARLLTLRAGRDGCLSELQARPWRGLQCHGASMRPAAAERAQAVTRGRPSVRAGRALLACAARSCACAST